ncbi:nuclear pore complex protein Nup133 [Microplitis demolitor]|uniref:nuclear pore complex protein Nup133 n=1 Tax=Microplitis demolitor TaxID=69319 RepID=UPI0004CD89BD|nr:nuclear pore complex protein Nup133 [Microplitis demolitor]XP_008544818.1 nuclear pore complex protein Nup133 [Microplitis demolitor]XP_008544819.1 nuclear pore complex protein Nup133 [Microplitis demolitor]XP_008544820.1 nuclear pore complex protein Nup133 [Microplitis demolitor]
MDRHSIGSFMSRSVASPSRKRLSMAQSLRRQSSGVSISGRSNQSVQVLCRSAGHTVESFGSSLPVLVTEALTFVDRSTEVSVRVSQNGWAWLVCNRRLLVWQCKTTIHDPKQQRMAFKSQCRELLLPQSDLAHKADCISVWIPSGHQVPCCMAVSPEGIVRYWPSIAHEESSIEISAELAGQEVDCLTHIPGHGCILATTTCTVALLQPLFTAGRNNITCRVLRTSPGWLGGIGRRMSSLIFGTIPQSPMTETKLSKVLCTYFGDQGSRVLILAGSSLQYWSFPANDQEKMEFDEDVGHVVTQAFQRYIWDNAVCNPSNVHTWLIDMQTNDEGIVLLVAAHCEDISPQVQFALGLLQLNSTTLVTPFKWFMPIKLGPMLYQDNVDSTINSFRFILSGWEAIVYNYCTVLVINVTNENEQDKIDLIRRGEDKILGGDLCSNTPILFTRNLGLITIQTSDFTAQDLNSSYADISNNGMSITNTSIDGIVPPSSVAGDNLMDTLTMQYSNDKIREMYYTSDGVEQLKAAFLFHLRQNKAECQQILAELFPVEEEPVMDIDASLDTLALKVANKLIDDYPANDPRWANHLDSSLTITTVMSMQIPHQLEGKQKALNLFVNFLKEYGLWERFCAVTYRGVIMATSHVLGEYAEKIVAALAIFNLQNRYPELVDPVIERTLTEEAAATASSELTARDIFYRQVSTIHLVLPNLVSSALEVSQSEKPSQQISQYILQVNSILLGVLHEVIKFRQANADRFVPSSNSTAITEYLPWTAASASATGSVGSKQDLRNCLYTLQNLTLKHGVTGTNDTSLKSELYDQIVGLIDLILDGKKCHLESVRGTDKFEILLKQYEVERTNLIAPLIRNEQFENAAMLAEKYCDFASLVRICELTDNKTQLDNYAEKFAAQDFAGFLFSWYVRDGRSGQLVDRCRREGAGELMEKISEHPELSWVQNSLMEEYRLAANTLHKLAMKEVELVRRKKSMLCLSKLALICSDEIQEEINENCEKIDRELELIAHQEELPADVLEAYGYDTKKLRVLTPVELITLYTCEENLPVTDFDFKKALDLLDYVDENEDKMGLKLSIWARAAQRDRWDTVSKNPEQQIQQTLFFKIISLIHLHGDSINDFLPPLDLLLSDSNLGTLADSSNFQYLIRLIYEFTAQHFQLNAN